MGTVVQELATLKRDLKKVQSGSRYAAGGSIENGAVNVYDADGSLRAIVGQQSDGTTGVNVVNGGPPPVPTAPSVEPAIGGIAIAWDGEFADGQILPLDWQRVEIHASPIDSFPAMPATLQATIETPQGGIVYLPASGPMYVRLLSRNTSGTASDATAQVGPVSPDPTVPAGSITATEIADGAVTTPKIFANAVTTAHLAAGSVDATAIAADAITGKIITGGEVNGAVITGGTVQTASSGERVALEGGGGIMRIYRSDGSVGAAVTPMGGTNDRAGFLALSNLITTEYAMLAAGELEFGDTAQTFFQNPGISAFPSATDPISMVLLSGRQAGANTSARVVMESATAGSNPLFYATGDNGILDFWINGKLRADNIAYGQVTIVPSAANTPTSATVSGLSLTGTTFRPFVTANSAVPGTSMLGVSASNPTSSGLTIWLTRNNTASTTVYWLLMGA